MRPTSTHPIASKLGGRVLSGMVCLCLVWSSVGCLGLSRPVAQVTPPSLNWLSQLVPGTPTPTATVDLNRIKPTEFAEIVHPGDLMELTVWDLFEPGRPQTAPIRISTEGKISPPLLEEILLSGMTFKEAETELSNKYRSAEILQQPRILVRRLEPAQCQVTVSGGVQRPGVVKLSQDQASVYQSLMNAGGLSPTAGHHVQLLRTAPDSKPTPSVDPSKDPIPVEAVKNEAAPSDKVIVNTLNTAALNTPHLERWYDLISPQDCDELVKLRLQDGDQLIVREETRPVRITGQVQNPGSYTLPSEKQLNALEALQLAGGPTITDLPLQLTVTRPVTEEKKFDRWSFVLDPAHPRNDFPIVQPGDQLHLETTPRGKVERVVGGVTRRRSKHSTSTAETDNSTR